jgi:hypothetical protein
MIWRIALAGIAAVALTIAPALIEGHYLNRWGTPADLTAAAKQVEAFPREFGAWTFTSEGEKMPDIVCRELGLAGYLSRSYSHRENGAIANVLLMVGQPGPLVRHPPNICYANRNNVQVGDGEKFPVKATTPASEFKLLEFKRPQSVTNDRFMIGYAMSTGADWQVPNMPRLEYGASPMLYKVQLLVTLDPSQSREQGIELMRQLTTEFCQAFQKHLK